MSIQTHLAYETGSGGVEGSRNSIARLKHNTPRAPHPPTMNSRSIRSLVTLLLLSLLLLVHLPTGAEAAKKKKKDPQELRAVKSDVKYIRCQVCQEVAKVLSREASTLRETKGAKLKESDVLEKVEKVCDPEAVEGEWLNMHDLQEYGSALAMVHMKDQYGSCGSDCKTMQRACEKIVSDRDTTVAEVIFTGQLQRAALVQHMCHNDDEDGFGACLAKAKPLPKTRPKGPAFDAVDKKELDMQRMMKNMKDMGMGGMSMYNRDDMEDMMDDEDIEDPSLTDNPYKDYDPSILDPEEPEPPGFAEKVTDAVAGAGAAIRGGLDAAVSWGKGLFAPSKASAAKAETESLGEL